MAFGICLLNQHKHLQMLKYSTNRQQQQMLIYPKNIGCWLKNNNDHAHSIWFCSKKKQKSLRACERGKQTRANRISDVAKVKFLVGQYLKV